ncbi:hypothetical protein FB451DRAFT_720387 [Mycena latifolia]|nr:hypothetical protein FB451DRAFT_720387 [Mycena latifolia]
MDFVSLAPEQPINDPLSERAPFLYRPVSPAVQASGVSIPKHVQVIRRRKPFQNDVEDEQTGLIDTADDSITTSAHTPPNYYLEVIHKLYMWVLLGLPNHYSRDAPSILGRINDGVTHPVYTRWVNEWITIGGAAFLLILFISQRSSASYDLLPRAMLFVSVVFLFFSVLYAIILARTFGKLEIDTEGLDWIRQVPQPPKNRFWNPWIMVSMPAVCILWGVTLFILSFIWRTGDTHGRDEASNPSPKQKYEYGPQIAATFAFVLGVIYLRLMVRDVKTMGSDSGAQPTVPGTLLREVSNVVLPDLVGRAEQIVQVFGHIFSINGGVGGPGGHNGGNGGNGGGSQVEIHPGRYSNCTHGAGGPGGSGHIGGRGGDGEEPDVETMPGGYFGNISGGTGGAGGTGNVVGGPGGTGEGTTIQYVSNTSGGSDEMAGSPASTY